MPEIRGVEIFRTGKWNGDLYVEADLDVMVAAFDRVGFRPPLKLGHSADPGGRAFGWIANLRRIGDKLVADFTDVPDKLFKLIRERAFDAVSAEIFWKLERGGRVFKRVLKAVALLGEEIPAVADLAPLRTVVNELSGDWQAIVFHDFSVEPREDESRDEEAIYRTPYWRSDDEDEDDDDEEGFEEHENMASTDPGCRLDSLAKNYAATHNCAYESALERMMASHPELAIEYAASAGTPTRLAGFGERPVTDEPDRTGEAFHEAILAYRQSHDVSYAQAFEVVARREPALARQYAES